MITQKIKPTAVDLLLLAGIGAAVVWFIYQAAVQADYRWNWRVIPQYLLRFDEVRNGYVPGLILEGVLVTVRLSVWATLLAMLAGITMGLCRTSCNGTLKAIGSVYVGLIRNIPVIVWIFIFYYFIADRLMPAMGVNRLADVEAGLPASVLGVLVAEPARLPTFVAGVMALAVYEGAYITEIIRAGIQSVDKGQWEASAGLGFTRMEQLRHIIFPQALRRVMPPLAGQFISTIKDSAIVSVISIQELTFQGMELMAATFLTFEVWLTILAIYFLLCLTCSLAVERFELRLHSRTHHG